jgi:protein arginine N-methyltransferase 3
VSSAISREDFQDDKFLKPVLEDDALLISLDDLPEIVHSGEGSAEVSSTLVTRVSELEEELRRVQSQFEDYRATVKQALDERWSEKAIGSSDGVVPEVKRDDDSHYFSSYSYNGAFAVGTL